MLETAGTKWSGPTTPCDVWKCNDSWGICLVKFVLCADSCRA